MKLRLILPLLFLTLAGLACNLPASATPVAASPSPAIPTVEVATATPVPTPLKARHYFFEDDFDGDFLGWVTNVTSGDPGLLSINTQQGSLVFDVGQKKLNALAFFQAGAYKNVWIDLRVVNRSETSHAVDMICRYDEDDGWYQFEVFETGLFNLYYVKWDSDQNPQMKLLTKGGSSTMRTGKAANDLTMICKDRLISLYVNGVLAVSHEENQYALHAGQVGIGITTFDEAPVIVALDWFKLETP